MKTQKKGKTPAWRKTHFSNLVRYEPSNTYFARIRINGKLIRQSLETTVLSVAKLRLADLEKEERKKAENLVEITDGKMTFGSALAVYRKRLEEDPSLKPKTKDYHRQRIASLLKSWPDLEKLEIRRITKSECLSWAAGYAKTLSPIAFNHTIGILGKIIEIGIESGARYENPFRAIKRLRENSKKPLLPEADQFEQFVQEIENSGSRFSKPCANLVRFLAYGGFRKSEAANITWADCDSKRQKILVRGDPETGTKNSEVREVPMIPEMQNLLLVMRTNRSSEAPESKVMLVHECQKAMDRAAKLVGMSRITHHDLRHLFATRCIESGVDIPTVSRWLGHKDGGALAMKVYGHLRDQHSVAMAQKVKFKI